MKPYKAHKYRHDYWYQVRWGVKCTAMSSGTLWDDMVE